MISETVYVVMQVEEDGIPDDQYTCVFGSVERAVEYRDDAAAEEGGDFRVFRMEPLPESAHWDWAVDHGTGHGPVQYVNERAARSSRLDGAGLYRRRAGTSVWEPVDPAQRCPRCGNHRDLHPKWAVCPPCAVAEGWKVTDAQP